MIIRGHRIFMWLVLQIITTTITITITMIILTITTILIIILHSLTFRSLLLHPLLLLPYKILHEQSPSLPSMSEVSIILPNSMRSSKIVLMNLFPLSAYKRANFLNEMLMLSLRISAHSYRILICTERIGVLILLMPRVVSALFLLISFRNMSKRSIEMVADLLPLTSIFPTRNSKLSIFTVFKNTTTSQKAKTFANLLSIISKLLSKMDSI